jgi:hypothetical protein
MTKEAEDVIEVKALETERYLALSGPAHSDPMST